MKKTLFFVVFLSNLLTINAQSDFKLAFELKGKAQWFVKTVGNDEAWVETKYPIKKVKSKKTGKISILGGDSTMEYWICDCRYKRHNIESRVLYNKNGEQELELPDVFRERVYPDTPAERVLQIICGKEEYLEDIRQREFDDLSINKELKEFKNRYDNYIDGYKAGYKNAYCAPYNDCFIKKIETPSEAMFAENPEDDYVKGYQDGKIQAEKDKK